MGLGNFTVPDRTYCEGLDKARKDDVDDNDDGNDDDGAEQDVVNFNLNERSRGIDGRRLKGRRF